MEAGVLISNPESDRDRRAQASTACHATWVCLQQTGHTAGELFVNYFIFLALEFCWVCVNIKKNLNWYA